MLWTTFGGLFFVFYSIQTFMPTVVASMGFTLTSAFAFTAVIVLVSIRASWPRPGSSNGGGDEG